jgi:hypothetical protein
MQIKENFRSHHVASAAGCRVSDHSDRWANARIVQMKGGIGCARAPFVVAVRLDKAT